MKTQIYKPPFPWFGGKSKVAHLVWERFGNVPNYVEPFFGSGTVMFLRPHEPNTETVNDADCIAPETKILRADLTWTTAGQLNAGDRIIGFDEEPRPGLRAPQRYRHWKFGTVEAVEARKRPCYRLTFDDGTTVVASEGHLWLGGSHRTGGRGWRWQATKGLVCNRRTQSSWLLKLCATATREETYDAGWIAGFFDGEGNLASAPGWRCVASQNPGVVFDRAVSLLRARGFQVGIPNTGRKVNRLEVNGGMREILRFLMTFRPERLICNFEQFLPMASLYGRKHQAVRLVEKEYLGEREVIAIQTDIKTYIAEGLASHNCYVSNFWRATKENPSEVAKHADNPVNEADLLARHKWLIAQQRNGFAHKMKTDPDFYDVKIAGWWVWGICCWIGQEWCRQESNQLPHLGNGQGINRKLPHLGDAGRGINRKLPHLGDAGRGINRKLPHLGDAGQGIAEYLQSLQKRLRHVRVACGDWTRVLGDSVTFKHGITGIFLDPPYSADECNNAYSVESNVTNDVRQWTIENGENKLLRIALCGYDTEHEMPSNWKKIHWKRHGGFSVQAKKETKAQRDRFRETIWFSPHCLNNKQETLF